MIIAGLGVVVRVMTGYYSMFYLTLSRYITLGCMDPFATPFLCRVFYHERVTKLQSAAAVSIDPLVRLFSDE